MEKQKIALICARTFTVIKFRKGLVEELKKNNYDVYIIALDDRYKSEIEEWGVNFYYIYHNNRSFNPFEKISFMNRLSKLLEYIHPNKVLTFQLTPNTFGIYAAHKAKINNIYSKVEGAGDVFIYNTLKWKIIRFITCMLYKKAFVYSKKIIFENNDDRNEFVQRKLLKEQQTIVIPSVGVDVERFSYKPIINTNSFIMIARMMPTKGVIEYCKAARIVRKTHPEAIFYYVGEEFTLKVKDIQEYIDDGSICYLGYQEDVRPWIEKSFVHILPSYREGFGVVVIEAGAVGRMSIASNVQGCRDSVEDGYSGYLFDLKDYNMLAEKMIYALEHVDETIQMGKNARQLAENKFNKDIINKEVLKVINNE